MSEDQHEKAEVLLNEIKQAGDSGLKGSEIRERLGAEFLGVPLDKLLDKGKIIEAQREEKTASGKKSWVTVYTAPIK